MISLIKSVIPTLPPNKLIIGNIKMNMRFGEIPNYIDHFKNIKNKRKTPSGIAPRRVCRYNIRYNTGTLGCVENKSPYLRYR